MLNLILLLATSISLLPQSYAQNAQKLTSPSVPQEITLNQKSVAEMVLKQGPRTLEVNLRYQQYRLDPAIALSAYDWRLLAETGKEWDKSASILTSTSTATANYERLRTSVALQKPFTTGTLLGLELNRLNQTVSFNGTPTSTPPPDQTLDSAGITLEQSLLGNFFGVADRGIVNAAELNYEANNIARADELEGVVLQAIRQFWNSYVAQESFREAVNSRDRYKKLVDAIKKKTSLGYSNPGDLPQVQAEFESREQKVNTTSYEFLKSNEDLLTLLGLPQGTKINFEIPRDIPPVPNLVEKKPEELRAIRAQKLRAEAAEEALTAAKSLRYPNLSFVGSAYTSGVGVSAQDSYSDLTSGARPKYYAGLKLQYNFGSGIQSETVQNRQFTRDLQSSVLSRQLLESLDSEAQSKRRVEAQYTIALSTKRQREFREKASQELNRSYNQGRTDISILITALNNFFDAEVQYVRSLGDYAIALNEWAAIRDELVADDAPAR